MSSTSAFASNSATPLSPPHSSGSATPRPSPARTTTSPEPDNDSVTAAKILSRTSNDDLVRAAVAHSPSLTFSLEMILSLRDQRNRLKKMLQTQNVILNNVTNDIVLKGFLDDVARENERRIERRRTRTPSTVFPTPPPRNVTRPGERENPIDVDAVPSRHTRAGRGSSFHPNVARYGQRNISTNDTGRTRCFQCNQLGHWASTCGQFQCAYCLRYGPGHYPSRCPERARYASNQERLGSSSPVYDGDDGYDDVADSNITGEPCGNY